MLNNFTGIICEDNIKLLDSFNRNFVKYHYDKLRELIAIERGYPYAFLLKLTISVTDGNSVTYNIKYPCLSGYETIAETIGIADKIGENFAFFSQDFSGFEQYQSIFDYHLKAMLSIFQDYTK